MPQPKKKRNGLGATSAKHTYASYGAEVSNHTSAHLSNNASIPLTSDQTASSSTSSMIADFTRVKPIICIVPVENTSAGNGLNYASMDAEVPPPASCSVGPDLVESDQASSSSSSTDVGSDASSTAIHGRLFWEMANRAFDLKASVLYMSNSGRLEDLLAVDESFYYHMREECQEKIQAECNSATGLLLDEQHQLEADYKDLEAVVDPLRLANAELTAANGKLEADNETTLALIPPLELECRQLGDLVLSLKDQLIKANMNINLLNSAKSDQDAMIAALHEQIKELTAKTDELTATNGELTKINHSLETDTSKAAARIEELEADAIIATKQTTAAASLATARIEEFETKMVEFHQTMMDITEKKDKLKEEIKEIEKSKETLNHSLATSESMRAAVLDEVNQVTLKLRTVTQEKESLEEANAALLALNTALETKVTQSEENVLLAAKGKQKLEMELTTLRGCKDNVVKLEKRMRRLDSEHRKKAEQAQLSCQTLAESHQKALEELKQAENEIKTSAALNIHNEGVIKILSTDLMKATGWKVRAQELERKLLAKPDTSTVGCQTLLLEQDSLARNRLVQRSKIYESFNTMPDLTSTCANCIGWYWICLKFNSIISLKNERLDSMIFEASSNHFAAIQGETRIDQLKSSLEKLLSKVFDLKSKNVFLTTTIKQLEKDQVEAKVRDLKVMVEKMDRTDATKLQYVERMRDYKILHCDFIELEQNLLTLTHENERLRFVVRRLESASAPAQTSFSRDVTTDDVISSPINGDDNDLPNYPLSPLDCRMHTPSPPVFLTTKSDEGVDAPMLSQAICSTISPDTVYRRAEPATIDGAHPLQGISVHEGSNGDSAPSLPQSIVTPREPVNDQNIAIMRPQERQSDCHVAAAAAPPPVISSGDEPRSPEGEPPTTVPMEIVTDHLPVSAERMVQDGPHAEMVQEEEPASVRATIPTAPPCPIVRQRCQPMAHQLTPTSGKDHRSYRKRHSLDDVEDTGQRSKQAKHRHHRMSNGHGGRSRSGERDDAHQSPHGIKDEPSVDAKVSYKKHLNPSAGFDNVEAHSTPRKSLNAHISKSNKDVVRPPASSDEAALSELPFRKCRTMSADSNVEATSLLSSKTKSRNDSQLSNLSPNTPLSSDPTISASNDGELTTRKLKVIGRSTNVTPSAERVSRHGAKKSHRSLATFPDKGQAVDSSAEHATPGILPTPDSVAVIRRRVSQSRSLRPGSKSRHRDSSPPLAPVSSKTDSVSRQEDLVNGDDAVDPSEDWKDEFVEKGSQISAELFLQLSTSRTRGHRDSKQGDADKHPSPDASSVNCVTSHYHHKSPVKAPNGPAPKTPLTFQLKPSHRANGLLKTAPEFQGDLRTKLNQGRSRHRSEQRRGYERHRAVVDTRSPLPDKRDLNSGEDRLIKSSTSPLLNHDRRPSGGYSSSHRKEPRH